MDADCPAGATHLPVPKRTWHCSRHLGLRSVSRGRPSLTAFHDTVPLHCPAPPRRARQEQTPAARLASPRSLEISHLRLPSA